MNSQGDLVSIVIPCFRGEKFLEKAIESCLQQTFANLEIIVVDDASPDRCAEIAARYSQRDSRVKLIRHPVNRGVAAAFNSGYDAATGAFMTRLAQDDWFAPQAIQSFLACLASTPSASLVYADETVWDESGQLLREKKKDPPERVMASKNGPGMCFLWRRQIWEALNKFDSKFDSAEDYEFLQRAFARFSVAHCQESLLNVTVHQKMGSNLFAVEQELAVQRVKVRGVPGLFRKQAFLARAYFNAGYGYRAQQRFLRAARSFAISILLWPFQIASYKGGLNLLCVTTLRLTTRRA